MQELARALKTPNNRAAQDLSIGYSLLRSYYNLINKRYKKEPVICPEPSENVEYYDIYDEPCDNDPDLDIQTGYRVYAQEGLNFKLDYQAGLDTYFKAGNLKYFSARVHSI